MMHWRCWLGHFWMRRQIYACLICGRCYGCTIGPRTFGVNPSVIISFSSGHHSTGSGR